MESGLLKDWPSGVSRKEGVGYHGCGPSPHILVQCDFKNKPYLLACSHVRVHMFTYTHAHTHMHLLYRRGLSVQLFVRMCSSIVTYTYVSHIVHWYLHDMYVLLHVT